MTAQERINKTLKVLQVLKDNNISISDANSALNIIQHPEWRECDEFKKMYKSMA